MWGTRKWAGAAAAAGVLMAAGCGAGEGPAEGPGSVGAPVDGRVKAESPAPGYERYSVDPTAPTPEAPEVCPESGVSLTAGEPDAAMGLRGLTVYAVNCGKSPRTVEGYPLTRVLDEDHNRLEVTVHQGSSVTTGIADPAPTRIALRPGERALTVLVWRNTVTDSTVVATTGAYLEMTPVKGAPPQLVPMMVDLGNTGKLDVTAWRRPVG